MAKLRFFILSVVNYSTNLLFLGLSTGLFRPLEGHLQNVFLKYEDVVAPSAIWVGSSIIYEVLFCFFTIDAQFGHLIGKCVAIHAQKRRCRAFDIAGAPKGNFE